MTDLFTDKLLVLKKRSDNHYFLDGTLEGVLEKRATQCVQGKKGEERD